MENIKYMEDGHFSSEEVVDNGYWQEYDEDKREQTRLRGIYTTIHNEGTMSYSSRYEVSVNGVVTIITHAFTRTQVTINNELTGSMGITSPRTSLPKKIGYNASVSVIQEEGKKPRHTLKYEISSKLITAEKRKKKDE